MIWFFVRGRWEYVDGSLSKTESNCMLHPSVYCRPSTSLFRYPRAALLDSQRFSPPPPEVFFAKTSPLTPSSQRFTQSGSLPRTRATQRPPSTSTACHLFPLEATLVPTGAAAAAVSANITASPRPRNS
ncbi:unnamed protein product [Phaeothamnion confervicola]